MAHYNIIALGKIIDDKESCESMFSRFECPLNTEVENFLRDRSIEFEKMGLSRTYFIFTSYKNENILIGYYAIAVKQISMVNNVSINNRKKISGYANKKECAIYLIGQLGKNYKDNIDKKHLITGKELIRMAIEKILLAHQIIGGRAIVVECEDKCQLRQFYESMGFALVDKDKTDQLLRYYIGIDSIEL